MESFNKDELNAIGLMVSNAAISGKDAAFVAALLAKIQRMLNAASAPKEDVQIT
jgi:hypothetical protein